MFFYLILAFASVYFFVPLLLGWIVLSLSGDGKLQRVIGWAMVALGVWGAVSGVPYWYAQVSQGFASKNYMEERCKSAVVKLPPDRLPTDGIVLVQKRGNAFTSRMSRTEERSLMSPALGLFQRLQVHNEIPGGAGEFVEWAWEPSGVPEMGAPKQRNIEALTLPYELLIESLTTLEDQKHRVEGVEVVVRDRATKAVVARKVLFAQWPERSDPMNSGPSRVCPAPVPEEAKCASPFNDCDLAAPFVLRALKPQTDLPESQLFHLYRGMGKNRYWNCSGDILVAPGISKADIEWWSDGREGWEDLHLRVRGSSAELICDSFHWGGAMFRPEIRLGDGGSFPTVLLANAFKGKPSPSPRSLAESGH